MSARIFHSVDQARGHFGPSALAIGNFDGVHIGHQALLRQAASFAAQNALTPAVLTFDPHPTVIVAPDRTPPLICTLEERLHLLQLAGAAHILVLPFTHQIAQLSPEAFVSQILTDGLDTKAVFVGDNFRFGHKQAGNAETLRRLGERYGFTAQFVSPVTWRDHIVSSSLVRADLASGNVARAGRLLGHCFTIEGTVIPGHGVGSKQTVPTLNLPPPPGQLIPRGVYVTETLERGTHRRWPSITNAGIRPTFGGDQLTIETFLLGPLEGHSPEHIQVYFRLFLRGERQFPSPEALKTQIFADVARAQAFWRRISKLTPSIPL